MEQLKKNVEYFETDISKKSKLKNVKIGKILGSGAFGIVYEFTSSDVKVPKGAVKIIFFKDDQFDEIRNELSLLNKLSLKIGPELYDSFFIHNNLNNSSKYIYYIFMEYFDSDCNLFLFNNNNSINDKKIVVFKMISLIKSLIFDYNILCVDIKPNNFLIKKYDYVPHIQEKIKKLINITGIEKIKEILIKCQSEKIKEILIKCQSERIKDSKRSKRIKDSERSDKRSKESRKYYLDVKMTDFGGDYCDSVKLDKSSGEIMYILLLLQLSSLISPIETLKIIDNDSIFKNRLKYKTEFINIINGTYKSGLLNKQKLDSISKGLELGNVFTHYIGFDNYIDKYMNILINNISLYNYNYSKYKLTSLVYCKNDSNELLEKISKCAPMKIISIGEKDENSLYPISFLDSPNSSNSSDSSKIINGQLQIRKYYKNVGDIIDIEIRFGIDNIGPKYYYSFFDNDNIYSLVESFKNVDPIKTNCHIYFKSNASLDQKEIILKKILKIIQQIIFDYEIYCQNLIPSQFYIDSSDNVRINITKCNVYPSYEFHNKYGIYTRLIFYIVTLILLEKFLKNPLDIIIKNEINEYGKSNFPFSLTSEDLKNFDDFSEYISYIKDKENII